MNNNEMYVYLKDNISELLGEIDIINSPINEIYKSNIINIKIIAEKLDNKWCSVNELDYDIQNVLITLNKNTTIKTYTKEQFIEEYFELLL